MAVPPPVQADKLGDILPANLKTPANKWDPKYDNVTRGDLMRIGGWMPMIPGSNPQKFDPAISLTMLGLTPDDLTNIARVLEQHNTLTYGHSVYVCCTCV